MAHCRLWGALGSSSCTLPLPEGLPTNTPGPTFTEGLLPMITEGWGASDDFVPSGHTMASPVNVPARPSSHVTALPLRLQVCAAARDTPEASSSATANHPLVRTVIAPFLRRRDAAGR